MQKKSVTDEWIINHLPKRTKKFVKEVEDFTFERGFMFTKRIAGHRLGYCTKCNRWVPLEMSGYRTVTPEMQTAFAARHNEPALCPHCHSPVTFKDTGRGRSRLVQKGYVVKFDKMPNGALLARSWCVRKDFRGDFQNVPIEWSLHYVLYFDLHDVRAFKRELAPDNYYAFLNTPDVFYDDRDGYWGIWLRRMKCFPQGVHWPNGFGYLYNIPDTDWYGRARILKSNLKYCAADRFRENYLQGDSLLHYLRFYSLYPVLAERMVKQGFGWAAVTAARCALAADMNQRATTVQRAFYCNNREELQNVLKILHSGRNADLPLRGLRRLGIPFTQEVLDWAAGSGYTLRQALQTGRADAAAVRYCAKKHVYLHDYLDYLKFCENLHVDLSRKSKRFPKDFKTEHDRLQALERQRVQREKAKSMRQKDAAYRKRLPQLQEQYGFASGGLLIRPANSGMELIAEGETQNICVGGTHYINRMQRCETYIFFIRRETEPDRPYVTLELSTAGTVVQARGYANRRPDDEVFAFIEKWKQFFNLPAARRAQYRAKHAEHAAKEA